MTELKVGDKVWLRGTKTKDNGVSGFMPTWEREYIPDSDNLAAVARFIADHGSAVTAAVEMAYVDSVERGDRKELSDALRELTAALNGNGE